MALHTACIGIITVACDHRIRRAVEQGNFGVAKLCQMVDCQVDSLETVSADIGDIWIFGDIIVKEHCRDCGGSKLCHPRVFQGKTNQKTAVISILNHIAVVGVAQLQKRCDGRDGNFPIVAHCCLFKTKNDVKSEVSGFFILHIFNKNAQAFSRLFFHSLCDISHLDCGIQHQLF